MNKFKLVAPYQPMGDQIEAIQHLTQNIELGISEQTLLGATGTGKTFTIANVIANVNKPTIVLAHNKTLAGQLYAELKSLCELDEMCEEFKYLGSYTEVV